MAKTKGAVTRARSGAQRSAGTVRATASARARPTPVERTPARSTRSTAPRAADRDPAPRTADRDPATAPARAEPPRPAGVRGDPSAPGQVEPGDRSAPAAPAGAAPAAAAGNEPLATRDVARLLHYGERIGGDKIDVRMLPLQFHAGSGALALCDPSRPDTWRVLARPIGSGAFRVMLSIARPDGPGAGSGERLAAAVIHVGRPPIARWTVAQIQGGAARSADGLPRTPVTSGWLALLDASGGSPGVIALPPATGLLPIEVPLTDGRRALALPSGNGAFAAYWALDAAGKPVCVVIDFDAFPPKAWKARPPDRLT